MASMPPTWRDLLGGRIGIEGMGYGYRRIFTRGIRILVPTAPIQVLTHAHLDHMPAFAKVLIVPDSIVYKGFDFRFAFVLIREPNKHNAQTRKEWLNPRPFG